MTSEKARDFFSAYREGTLEQGLRISLERKFESDADLQAEYSGFCEALDSLGGLKNEVIELPFDLHELISARVDRDIWEHKRMASVGWLGRLRLAGMVGVGALVLCGAVFSLSHRGSGSTTEMGPGFEVTGSSLEVTSKPDGLYLTFAPSSDKEVLMRSGSSALPFQKEVVGKNSPLNQRLDNNGEATVLLKVEVQDTPASSGQLEIAIPGHHRDGGMKGSGTLEEFAKALAGQFRESVLLTGVDPETEVAWDFSQADGRRAAQAALGDRFTVDQTDTELITIRRGK